MPRLPTSGRTVSPSERDPDRLSVEELCDGAVETFKAGVVVIDCYPHGHILYAVNPDDMVIVKRTDLGLAWQTRVKA
jgi:hypothetical protein